MQTKRLVNGLELFYIFQFFFSCWPALCMEIDSWTLRLNTIFRLRWPNQHWLHFVFTNTHMDEAHAQCATSGIVGRYCALYMDEMRNTINFTVMYERMREKWKDLRSRRSALRHEHRRQPAAGISVYIAATSHVWSDVVGIYLSYFSSDWMWWTRSLSLYWRVEAKK